MIDLAERAVEALSSQEFPPTNSVVRMATARGIAQPGYYGLPLVKPPLWKWEIALYFFFEGISAGSFVLSGMADLFGGRRYRELVRKGRYVAFLAFLPCPPLLIRRPRTARTIPPYVANREADIADEYRRVGTHGIWGLYGAARRARDPAVISPPPRTADGFDGPAFRAHDGGVSRCPAFRDQQSGMGAQPVSGRAAGVLFVLYRNCGVIAPRGPPAAPTEIGGGRRSL
jgi:hypothetical protein